MAGNRIEMPDFAELSLSHRRSPLFLLFNSLLHWGVRDIVISPGSRSAPLTLIASRSPEFNVHIAVDERSAGYRALGISRGSKQPVAIICTSGTAALNLYPAITEAFYLQVPLIVLTADRPASLIDQQDGQAIRQKGLYHNHIRTEYSLPEEEGSAAISESMGILEVLGNLLKQSPSGPVHLNIPLKEPLYDVPEGPFLWRKPLSVPAVFKKPLDPVPQNLLSEDKILIVLGQGEYSANEQKALAQLAERESITVVTECLSNVSHPLFVRHGEQILQSLPEHLLKELQPNVLLTAGLGIVSKQMKAFLRRFPPQYHYHLSEEKAAINTFGCLTEPLHLQFEQLLPFFQQLPLDSVLFQTRWLQAEINLEHQLEDYKISAPWSEWWAMSRISEWWPNTDWVHLANSMPVRFGNLFFSDFQCFSNRGTSGIDGCTSTAFGFALAQPNVRHLLITGDLAFLYDQNALWPGALPDNLRIIVSNNGGGGIFRLIDGPSNVPELTHYFETPQQVNFEHLCAAYRLSHCVADNKVSLKSGLDWLLNHEKAALLEVRTLGEENQRVFHEFRSRLRQ